MSDPTRLFLKLSRRFRALFAKRKLDSDMDEEMRSHIQMRTEANIETGMNPEEARYTALRQFGWAESIKETCREQRGVTWIENLIRDLRLGARRLRKDPGFTLVAVLTLALGVGANLAVLSLLNGMFFRPLPGLKGVDQLITIGSSYRGDGFGGVSYPAYIDLTQRNSAFSDLAALSWAGESSSMARKKNLRSLAW